VANNAGAIHVPLVRVGVEQLRVGNVVVEGKLELGRAKLEVEAPFVEEKHVVVSTGVRLTHPEGLAAWTSHRLNLDTALAPRSHCRALLPKPCLRAP